MSNNNNIERITIVGGGTAGWITAMFMNTALNHGKNGEKVHITLIESPNVPAIGVGEATVPGMFHSLKAFGIDEAEFLLRTNASFKCGVRFYNWTHDSDGNSRDYIHPFDISETLKRFDLSYYYHRFGSVTGAKGYLDNVLPTQAIADNYRGPKMLGMGNYEYAVQYTYHLDAGLFADYMTEVGTKRGIEHIRDDVLDVEQDENGFITALNLKEKGRHPLDLVIDCTGSRRVLIGKVLGEPYDTYEDKVLCDRALALQIPHEDPTRMKPLSESHGLNAGWAWRTPLYSRLGTGYVYSSNFASDEEAINEFRGFLGDKYKDAEPRVLHMHIGKTRRSWVKNCIAIGLSNGFVEPLEATAIFAIEMLNRWLIAHFPDKTFNPALINRYNQLTQGMFDEILDFITMHYYTSNRTDTPFWIAHREDIKISDTLRENLELWKHNLPTNSDIKNPVLFNHESYKDMLYGKGYFDNVTFPIEAVLEKEDWVQYSRELDHIKKEMVRQLPSNYELLTHIRKSKEEEYRIKEMLKQPMHTGDIPLTSGASTLFGSSMNPGPGSK